MSPMQEEEAALLGKPQEAYVTATHSPGCEEWAADPESTTGLGEAATKPQGMQVCLLPPGFESLPPEQDVPLIGIPKSG